MNKVIEGQMLYDITSNNLMKVKSIREDRVGKIYLAQPKFGYDYEVWVDDTMRVPLPPPEEWK